MTEIWEDDYIIGESRMEAWEFPGVTIGYHRRQMGPDCPKGWYCIVTMTGSHDPFNQLEVIYRGASSPNAAFDEAMDRYMHAMQQQIEYERDTA